jgi:hypothetical protein
MLVKQFFNSLLGGMLAGRHDDEQTPQAIAVGQCRKTVILRGPAEAVEGAESDVLLVGGTAGSAVEFFAGQMNEPLKIAFPEGLGGCSVAGLELADPVGDRSLRRHG